MNFASALKAEIVRIARKEQRAEIQSLRKSSAQYRSEIAALKRRCAALEKIARTLSKGTRKASVDVAEDDAVKPRFSAKSIAAQRQRLGLSAADFGALIGVSGQSIYHWEQGKSKPRQAQLQALHAVRKVGKREAMARLAQD